MNSNKIKIAFIIIGIIVCGCGGKDKSSWYDKIPDTDTTCLKELETAKKHFAEGKLVYCYDAGSLLYIPLRSENEMEELLGRYSIDYVTVMSSDCIIEGETQLCYCKFMQEKIAEKYGKNFIDSLIDVSDSLFVFRNLLDTFYYAQCDTWVRHPLDYPHNSESSEMLQGEFDKIAKYPKGYVRGETAFVNVYFIVNKEGKASITGWWFLFDNKQNEKYKEDFKPLIIPLIENTKWQPATIRGQKVISDMVKRIYFDW